MYRKLDKLVISLFLILTWSLTVNAASLPDGFPKCSNSDVNKTNFCPMSAKLGHKIFLLGKVIKD